MTLSYIHIYVQHDAVAAVRVQIRRWMRLLKCSTTFVPAAAPCGLASWLKFAYHIFADGVCLYRAYLPQSKRLYEAY